MHDIVFPPPPQKKYTQHFNKCCVTKNSYLSPLVLPSTCMCACVPTKVHLYMRIFLYINAFLCINMVAKYVMYSKIYNGIEGNKSISAQSKSMGHKKGSNQSNRSKLKRRVGMERCLPVGRVGED
jgi:hypothetical protein